MTTRLEDIKYACHLAALAAMDEVLAGELGLFKGKPVSIKDKHLPALLPALDHAIRGGSIWEICDHCGAKWADDVGGKPMFYEPADVIQARVAIAKAEGKV